jgi:hypothetical protein
MRKLLAILSVLTLAQAANAENNLTTSAEFRARVQNDMNNSGDDDTGLTQNAWEHRLKLGLNWNAGEKLSLHSTLLHNSTWGQELAGDTTDTGIGVRDGFTDGQNMILVNDAYATWMMSDSTSLRFGRGGFTIADGSVISQNDWEKNPYSFEGVMATHDMEFGRVSGFYVKVADYANTATTVEDPEASIYGLSLDVKSVPDMIKMLNIHVLKTSKDELPGNAVAALAPGKDYMRYGLTVGGETSGLDFNFTYASESGEILLEKAGGTNADASTSMMDLKVGYTLADVMGLRIGLDYHSDTGTSASATDLETYDSYYYEKHANAGKMDIFEWGNLTYMGVNLSMKPMDNTTVGLDYYMFSQTEKDQAGAVTGINGGAFAAAANATEDALGTEMDLWASHKYENGLEMTARYSMFTPGDEYKPGQEDAYSLIFVEGKLTF